MIRFFLCFIFFSASNVQAEGSRSESGKLTDSESQKPIREDRSCNTPSTSQAFEPVSWREAVICFDYEEVWHNGVRFPDVIAMRTKSLFGPGKQVHYFSGAVNRGTIQDVFLLSIAQGIGERFFVIYRDPNPNRWFSAVYQVSVFRLESGGLSLDDNISSFFGVGGDINHGDAAHIFPFKDRKSIEASVNSKFFRLALSSNPFSGTIQKKTYLYSEVPTADWDSITSSYLIKGDQVTILEVSTGWCNIDYPKKNKPITFWVECELIDVNK